MKKLILWLIGIIVVAFVVILFIPSETNPPEDARLILDYTHDTYIAPPCFEQSDPEPTNNIDETEWENAKDMYEAHDACTEEAMEPEEDTLGISLLKKIGLMNTKWDEW